MLPEFDFSPKFGIRTRQFWKTMINEFLVSCGFFVTNAGLGSTPATWGLSYLLWTTLSPSADILAPVTFLKAAFPDGKTAYEGKFFHAVCVMISQIFAVMVCFQTGGFPVGPLVHRITNCAVETRPLIDVGAFDLEPCGGMSTWGEVDTGNTRTNIDGVVVPVMENAHYGGTSHGITPEMILQFVAVFYYFLILQNKTNAVQKIPSWMFVWFSVTSVFWMAGNGSTLIPSRSFGNNGKKWSHLIAPYLNCFVGAFLGSRVGSYLFKTKVFHVEV